MTAPVGEIAARSNSAVAAPGRCPERLVEFADRVNGSPLAGLLADKCFRLVKVKVLT